MLEITSVHILCVKVAIVCADECAYVWVKKFKYPLAFEHSRDDDKAYEWADFLEVNNFMDLRNHFSFLSSLSP